MEKVNILTRTIILHQGVSKFLILLHYPGQIFILQGITIISAYSRLQRQAVKTQVYHMAQVIDKVQVMSAKGTSDVIAHRMVRYHLANPRQHQFVTSTTVV